MSDGDVKLLLVCEGDGDDDDLKALTLKVLHEAHPWMVGLETLDEPTPAWFEYEPGRRFLKWSDIDVVCDRRGVPEVHGLGLDLGRRAATRLTRLLSKREVLPEKVSLRVVLVHDADGNPAWRKRLEAARDEWRSWLEAQERLKRRAHTDVDIAVGVAQPEHEAWVLAAFEPRDADERERLKGARQRLGFDPCEQGQRLTSKRETDPKDAKRALREVCGEGQRRRALLPDVDLDLLRARGGELGLTAFLAELRDRIATAYGPDASTARGSP